MDSLLEFLASLNNVLGYLRIVNENPNEPPPRNNRRSLRRWRKSLQASWEKYADIELTMAQFKGVQWSAIISPTKYAFGYYEHGSTVQKVAELAPGDPTFFTSVTRLLIKAAAQEP